MMKLSKHTPKVLSAFALYAALSETDNILDSAEWIGAGDLFAEDGSFRDEAGGGWYVITWPDHVLTPQYNGDCSCHGPFESEVEARDYCGAV